MGGGPLEVVVGDNGLSLCVRLRSWSLDSSFDLARLRYFSILDAENWTGLRERKRSNARRQTRTRRRLNKAGE